MSIKLDGETLTVQQVCEVAHRRESAEFSDEAKRRIERSRAYVEDRARQAKPIYGVNTGFGSFASTRIGQGDIIELQKNLIHSHACGMGEPLPQSAVRAAMLLRCSALARGNSGIRLSTAQTLLDMLNRGVCPVIPEKGSLGASGDLAPLAHMVLVMLGEGEADYNGKRIAGGEALRLAGIAPVQLAEKEGLALINGTQIMAALGCIASDAMDDLLKTADIAAAMSCEALLGITAAFDERVHSARLHKGQSDSAANLRALLKGSSLASRCRDDRVQDAYSLRCAPQVHGASRDAAEYVRGVLTTEINSATDNPLIFPDGDEIISGGNFHGQPLALAMDFLGIAAAEIADISERRLERMVNPALSAGLPAFLTRDGGLNSGFMITQYCAAALVSENKVYAHPASVDSIPSSANQEDHVSMGNAAARKANMIIDNAQKVVAAELFAAAQALSIRGADKASPASYAVLAHIRKTVPEIFGDETMYPHMNELDRMVKNKEITAAAQAVAGDLK